MDPLDAISNDRWRVDTFTPDHVELLMEIRRELARETMLVMPDWNRDMHWRIDAQPNFGWAGVVGQVDESGKFWPIRFMSQRATEADKKRWPTEMEAMAWHRCLNDKGRVYSKYCQNIIHGDPKSLRWLADSIASNKANRQMQRVALGLQALRISFIYHPRAEMADVDALSRFCVADESNRAELEAFLASDKEHPGAAAEAPFTVAIGMPLRESLPTRLCDATPAIALPADERIGANSPPGVPINLRGEQKSDPICRFIAMVKRGEFATQAEEDKFLAGMPRKAHRAVAHFMTQTGSREFADFKLRDGKLFFVDLDRRQRPRFRLVVPIRLRTRVLTGNHDAPAAGHQGFDKTYATLQRLYFWFGMYADCKAWIRSCPACAKGKRRTIAGHGTAQYAGLVPTKYPPFARTVVDLIGPLLRSRLGMRHILVMVDAFSSETKLEALPSKSSDGIADKMLRRVVLSEGCPLSWQTDRAPELLHGSVKALAILAGIEAKACSAHEAHTEGRVERRNWSVVFILRELCHDDVANWPDYLPWVESALNSSPYSVTGETPYFHKTGYDPIMPHNLWREAESVELGEPMDTWRERMRHARALAELAHSASAEERKKYYDADKQPHTFKVGDNVYVWLPPAHKLDFRAVGPLVVKRFLDPDSKRTAVLHPPGMPYETHTVHVDRLVPAHARPPHLVSVPWDVSEWIGRCREADGDAEFIVEPDGPEPLAEPAAPAHNDPAVERTVAPAPAPLSSGTPVPAAEAAPADKSVARTLDDVLPYSPSFEESDLLSPAELVSANELAMFRPILAWRAAPAP